MSIRANDSADFLRRTTNVPTITSFTLMGWFYVVNAPGASSLGVLQMIGQGTGGVAYWAQVNDTMHLGVANPANSFYGSTVLSTGTWYHVALVGSGTGVNAIKVYLNGVQEQQCDGDASVTATDLRILNDTFSTWIDGRCDALKGWSAALTVAEIQEEMFTRRAIRRDNLNYETPCFPGATERLADYSGNGNNWTGNGTLTDEDPAPIGWGRPRLTSRLVVSAAPAPPYVPPVTDIVLRQGEAVPNNIKLWNPSNIPAPGGGASVTVTVPVDALTLETFAPEVLLTGHVIVEVPVARLGLGLNFGVDSTLVTVDSTLVTVDQAYETEAPDVVITQTVSLTPVALRLVAPTATTATTGVTLALTATALRLQVPTQTVVPGAVTVAANSATFRLAIPATVVTMSGESIAPLQPVVLRFLSPTHVTAAGAVTVSLSETTLRLAVPAHEATSALTVPLSETALRFVVPTQAAQAGAVTAELTETTLRLQVPAHTVENVVGGLTLLEPVVLRLAVPATTVEGGVEPVVGAPPSGGSMSWYGAELPPDTREDQTVELEPVILRLRVPRLDVKLTAPVPALLTAPTPEPRIIYVERDREEPPPAVVVPKAPRRPVVLPDVITPDPMMLAEMRERIAQLEEWLALSQERQWSEPSPVDTPDEDEDSFAVALLMMSEP